MNPYSVLAVLVAVASLTFFWFRKFHVTYSLIMTNVFVFGLQLMPWDAHASRSGSILVDDLAFQPIYLVGGLWARSYTMLTSAFLHAGFLHLFGNMLILLLAGVPFEERLGRGRFLGLYLFSAVLASVVHAAWTYYTAPTFQLYVPALGASGAIFGVLGGFATAYPKAKFPIFPIPIFGFSIMARNVPVVLGVLVLAVVEGFALFSVAGADGVAHAAHFGGAIGGSIAGLLLKVPEGPRGMRGRRRIDYERLGALATDEKTRGLVDRVRENGDTPELQRAWLDRLFVALRCPQCGHGYAEVKPGLLECDNGHQESYVR